jgi:hypothetical protein
MDSIEIIRDKASLEGTCYFELLPGKYSGKCWNDNSVFLTEEIWGFIEPVVRRIESRYDHYAFLDVPRSTWLAIVAELRRLSEQVRAASTPEALPSDLGYFWRETKHDLATDFATNREALTSLFTDVSDWLEEQFREHEFVAILGI